MLLAVLFEPSRFFLKGKTTLPLRKNLLHVGSKRIPNNIYFAIIFLIGYIWTNSVETFLYKYAFMDQYPFTDLYLSIFMTFLPKNVLGAIYL